VSAPTTPTAALRDEHRVILTALERLAAVTALEPAPALVRALRRAVRREGLDTSGRSCDGHFKPLDELRALFAPRPNQSATRKTSSIVVSPRSAFVRPS
jgi:hypothetical protein